jgi:hypothetical protein
MSQVVDLGSMHHLVVLVILIVVIWLLARDMGVGKEETKKKEGMYPDNGAWLRVKATATDSPTGTMQRASDFNPYVSEARRSGMYPWEPPVLQNSPMSDADFAAFQEGAAQESVEGMRSKFKVGAPY